MLTFGGEEYSTRLLQPDDFARWREWLNRRFSQRSKPYDDLYAKIQHLPMEIVAAMMREAIHLPSPEPSPQEFKKLAESLESVRCLAWVSIGQKDEQWELITSGITESNRVDVMRQIIASNQRMSATAAAEFLQKQRETLADALNPKE